MNKTSESKALIESARSDLSDYFGGADLSAFPASFVRDGINKMWLGGWESYAHRWAEENRATAEPTSPVGNVCRAQSWFPPERFPVTRMQPHDEVVNTLDEPNRRVAVLKKVKLREGRRIDTILGYETFMLIATREDANSRWKYEQISVTEGTHKLFRKF